MDAIHRGSDKRRHPQMLLHTGMSRFVLSPVHHVSELRKYFLRRGANGTSREITTDALYSRLKASVHGSLQRDGAPDAHVHCIKSPEDTVLSSTRGHR